MSPVLLQGLDGGPEDTGPGGVMVRDADAAVMYFEDGRAESQDKIHKQLLAAEEGARGQIVPLESPEGTGPEEMLAFTP